MASYSTHGPLFDHVAGEEISRYCDHLETRLAHDALDELEVEFHEKFKHPTGYYEAHVRVQSDPDGHVITDGGVVYGPWLEGTGSRDFPRTRFRGYADFRRVTARINAATTRVAEEFMPALLRRIG